MNAKVLLVHFVRFSSLNDLHCLTEYSSTIFHFHFITNKIDFSILKSNVISNSEIKKPKVELPKTIELPKKNNENFIETNIPDFEDIQGETYNISR